MRILISNDDGINAPGIRALAGAVMDLGEVIIVAPDSVQSGAGHGITVHHPLTVREVDVPVEVNGQTQTLRGRSVDGRPADCVRLALKTLLDEPVDLVLSGINKGANDGICVFYSGTVAAAAEACILGLPAVAFSAKSAGEPVDFAKVGKYCRWVLGKLLAAGLAPGDLTNVNIPNLNKPHRPRGVRVARMSTAGLEDDYVLVDKSQDRRIYKLAENYDISSDDHNSDSISLQEGYITITPLRVDMTNHVRLEERLAHDWAGLPQAEGG